MLSLRKIFLLAVAAVVAVNALRMLLPYEISKSQDLTPSVYQGSFVLPDDDYLALILKNNIWFEEREELVLLSEEEPVEEEVVEEVVVEDTTPARPTIKLVGVSTGEGPAFAVIQSNEKVERFLPGDTLPDESQLIEITSHGIETSYAGKNEKLYLFGKD